MWSSSVKQAGTVLTRLPNYILRKLGLEIHRYVSPADKPSSPLLTALGRIGADLIIDVGANVGQFAQQLRNSGYSGKIVSFEPLSGAYETLLEKSRGDANWVIGPRSALGDHNGRIDINVARNTYSSSILPMLELHQRAAPDSGYLAKENVPLETLDRVTPGFLKDSRTPFLKIDTQGYEWEVLDGARATLPSYKGLLVELSLAPLYEGQHLWMEMVERLREEGFILWAIKPVFHDPDDGRTLQVDGLFLRNS